MINDAAYSGIALEAIKLGTVLDIDLEGAYDEVVRSNYSKFPLAHLTDIDAELKWFNEESKYDNVCYEEFMGRLIFRCNNGEGKIVKPRCFNEPILDGYITTQLTLGE